MNTSSHSRIRILFYSLWVISLLIQAYFTELNADEAYYWLYSKKLEWGYFDHPPVIAALIKAGYFLFPNELGIRFISIIMGVCTILLWERIVRPKDLRIFYCLVASVGILHFTGFFAIPDSPLIFFLSVYLLLYREFTINPTFIKSLLLGIAGALMILSKYHGIVIVGLTVLSNLKLLLNRYFWLAAAVSAACLVPHFLWQVQAGFPSIKYHLSERNSTPYSFSFTLEYLIGQLFVLGPFTGILFFIALKREQQHNTFEKGLKFIFWGAYIFFFLMSFRGRVEAHWTLFTVVSAIYFGYSFFLNQKKTRKLFYSQAIVSLIIILVVKVLMIIELGASNNFHVQLMIKMTHNKKEMLLIKKQAGNYPVAFMNSYQNASLYAFYAKIPGFSLNYADGRKNQFNLWGFDEKYLGKKIMIIPNYDEKHWEFIPGTSIRYRFIESFQFFPKVKIVPLAMQKEVFASDTLKTTIVLKNAGKIDFEASTEWPSFIYCLFFEDDKLVKETYAATISNDMLNKNIQLNAVMPEKPGTYRFYFGIKTGNLPFTINSARYNLEINTPARKNRP